MTDWEEKNTWQKKVDEYLEILYTARSYQEVAKIMQVDEKTAWKNLKRMEKEGYIWSYKLNNFNKIGYIRRLPWEGTR